MTYYQLLKITLISIVTVSAIQPISKNSFAQSSTGTIHATVKLSVCGDGVAEGPEQCDNGDLKNSTCRSLGYDTGTLSCDPACEFDKTLCTGTAPVDQDPTPNDDDEEHTDRSQNESADNISLSERLTFLTRELLNNDRGLPSWLLFFDLNGNGVIDYTEVHRAMRLWITEWRNPAPNREICDVNFNGICNLQDLSVILYFVEGEN